MLIEVNDKAVEDYQRARLGEGTAGKTINEEVSVLFRIMGGVGKAVREKLDEDKKLKLADSEDVGRALTAEEQKDVLREAQRSKSPHIYTAVMIALNTGLRDSEIRHLEWRQIDFFKQILTVGKSKTREGTGRTIPLNSELLKALIEHHKWYTSKFGAPSGAHFVFPRGRGRYDAIRPTASYKTAWQRLQQRRYRPGSTI
jgi:integrase